MSPHGTEQRRGPRCFGDQPRRDAGERATLVCGDQFPFLIVMEAAYARSGSPFVRFLVAAWCSHGSRDDDGHIAVFLPGRPDGDFDVLPQRSKKLHEALD